MNEMKVELYLVFFVIIILILLIGYYYLFNIYEVDYDINTTKLYADNQSTFIIETKLINSFGFKIPFRDTRTKFEISEGKDLVDILINDNEKGILKLRAKNQAGTIVILVKSDFALLPSKYEIQILPNLT